MKYIAYEGTYNEQYYDSKAKVISFKKTDTLTQCDRNFRPDLQAIHASGKRIWVKKPNKD